MVESKKTEHFINAEDIHLRSYSDMSSADLMALHASCSIALYDECEHAEGFLADCDKALKAITTEMTHRAATLANK